MSRRQSPRPPCFSSVPSLVLLLLLTSCDLPDAPDAVDPPVVNSALVVEAPALETTGIVSRLEGAERVVVATVDRVNAAFGENEHGDRLIISTVTLRVHTTLRGTPAQRVTFELEGGSVGALKLEVSDMPTLRVGEHGLFALRRAATGRWVPNRRGLGLLQLPQLPDAQRLQQLQRAEEGTR